MNPLAHILWQLVAWCFFADILPTPPPIHFRDNPLTVQIICLGFLFWWMFLIPWQIARYNPDK